MINSCFSVHYIVDLLFKGRGRTAAIFGVSEIRIIYVIFVVCVCVCLCKYCLYLVFTVNVAPTLLKAVCSA